MITPFSKNVQFLVCLQDCMKRLTDYVTAFVIAVRWV